jgi:methionyl-tRNA synthetase
LANGFGNLASRVIAMIHRYFDGTLPVSGPSTEAELEIQKVAAEAVRLADAAIDEVAIHEAIAQVWTLVDALNGYITVQEPWALAKDEANRERLATVLYTTAEGLRALAVLLAPVVPKATAKLWSALAASSLGELADRPIREAADWGQLPAGAKIGELEPLFPRIEQDLETK